MNVTNYSNARKNFKELSDKINDDQEAITITTESNNAVFISESEYKQYKETVYLLNNPANANILLNPLIRYKLEELSNSMNKLNILFTHHAFSNYPYRQQQDRKMVKRINELLKSIQRDGALEGIGKPEKLKGNLAGFYSRRIDSEHRLVYTVDDKEISIISCRYHY